MQATESQLEGGRINVTHPRFLEQQQQNKLIGERGAKRKKKKNGSCGQNLNQELLLFSSLGKTLISCTWMDRVAAVFFCRAQGVSG